MHRPFLTPLRLLGLKMAVNRPFLGFFVKKGLSFDPFATFFNKKGLLPLGDLKDKLYTKMNGRIFKC